jgi:alanyl-tRNA synthetase
MKWRSGNELREMFLKYFEEKGSRRYPSFSLLPEDPTILFTIAGMVPFKPYFLGIRNPEVLRATTSQKCIRTNDIDNVGRTARHHTFFEMLGNFSFGDYFKREAIPWAWTFLTEHIGLDPDRLYATIYLDDDEAFNIWHRDVGLSENRIVRLGEDDNFWSVGPVGPCGPCSELLYDQGESFSCGSPDCAVGCDCDRYLEIWNLVFMQFNRNEAGELTPLPKQNIDTGMGLERLASVVQEVETDFETDLFRPLIDDFCSLAGISYGAGKQETMAARVVSDHLRAVSFMIADGILPSNEGRGYVLRRLLRRAARYGRLVGIERPFLADLLPSVISLMGGVYEELGANRSTIEQILQLEEQRFTRTLDQGCLLLDEEIRKMPRGEKSPLPGEVAFELYDTYGFPLELTEEICREACIPLDREGFTRAMNAQRERARGASKQSSSVICGDAFTDLLNDLGDTPFEGYLSVACPCTTVAGLFRGGEPVEELQEGESGEVVLDRTPFYAEKGGQVGDTGVLENLSGRFAVEDTRHPAGNLIMHQGTMLSGVLRVGDQLAARVDLERRKAISRNHTATHLLHEGLIRRLGEHVRQAGSLVAPDLLRFDFTHFEALKKEDLQNVEDFVNRAILQNLSLESSVTTLEEAKSRGAKALFGEKYGGEVRVVAISETSVELCGGVHVVATGELGSFKILREESVGSGTRRITAITGMEALRHHQELQEVTEALRHSLGCDVSSLQTRLEELQQELREAEGLLKKERLQGSLDRLDALLQGAVEIEGISLVTGIFPEGSTEVLLQVADAVRQRLSPVMMILAGVFEDRVQFVAVGDDEAVSRGAHAGKIIKEAAKIAGGGGGGKASMAQAGGKNPAKTEEALRAVPELLRGLLSKG